MKTKHLFVVSYLTACLSLSAQVFNGTNSPGTGTDFPFVVGSETNLSFTVNGTASAYSYVLVRKGSPATDTTYDFGSRLVGQTNGIYLEVPEVSSGVYYVRVTTPLASGTHAFSLTYATNATDLRTATKPVTKKLGTVVVGNATNNSTHYFRIELTTNTAWRASLESVPIPPDLYVGAGQLPTTSTFLKRSTSSTNDVLPFTASEGAPGVYYVGVFGAGVVGTAGYTLRLDQLTIPTLTWDPGTAHLGTQVYTNVSGVPGDYYFRINTANPSAGAWRTALRVLNGEAHLYLSRGVLPTAAVSDYKSERLGSDGLVLALTSQFLPSEDWYILVQAQPAAQWTLLSGSPYVMDLGTVAADASSGSGNVDIGPEGIRFFSAAAPADILAWRLYLNGATNNILIKKTSVPLPGSSFNEGSQPRQMLVVPPYLMSDQYLIGVPGTPGSVINLDSRQQSVVDIAYGGSISTNVNGFGYVTYRVQVPAQQIAWQMFLPTTNGVGNIAVRRNTVPNENNNDAYSELTNVVNNITLVPPILSDGTFYITVYGTNGPFQFTLQNGPATVTDINYISTILNDDPTRVGWRYYRVTDISQQLGSLGWDLLLTNSVPGTRIALRRNAAPSIWNYRVPSQLQANYYDVLSTADFLQDPAHQADVWYIGVYNPTNALGAFTLITRELQATTLSDNTLVNRTNVLSGRWEFFSLQLTPQMIQGGGGGGGSSIMGLDLRLVNVSSGLPRIIVRREGFPTNFNTTFTTTGPNWPSGGQWAAGQDWTRRTFSANGATNEDGRIMVMGIGRPLEAGTYYVGILNNSGSNNMSYGVLSRWIGPGQAIPVQDISWNGGNVTNTINPRDAAYYRVILPTNTPSWKVKLTTASGEAMLVNSSNTVPTVDSEKRMQKIGKEQYAQLPPSPNNFLVTTTNILTVIAEGQDTTNTSRIGTGQSTFVLNTLGAMPELDLGTLTTNDLLTTNSLDGGESTAYHFHTTPGTLGFLIFLENVIGNPFTVYRFGLGLGDPGYSGDTYGNEGGIASDVISSSFATIVTFSNNIAGDETIMVKARGSGYPDASYNLRVKQITPAPMNFDGATANVVNQPWYLYTFFAIDVPADALGWDLRITNVLSGAPTLVVARDVLPIAATTIGFGGSSPYTSIDWPSGARLIAGSDWTGRDQSPAGVYEAGRILEVGMGRPLAPGRYYVGILPTTTESITCTLVSRGIGTNYSIGVTDLSFAGGQVTVTNLQAREAAYYRVVVPPNATSWKVQLSATTGDSLLSVLKGVIPNVGATNNSSVFTSGGREMQRTGDEYFLLLPSVGSNAVSSGVYYLSVASEGQNTTNLSRIGTGSVSYTLTSIGQATTNYLGDVGLGELLTTNSLGGGDVSIYQFNVPAGIQTLEAYLENFTGNPMMSVWPGGRVPDPGANAGIIQADPYGNEGGETPLDVKQALLYIVNPTNGVYTLCVKARGTGQFGPYPNATYTLRIRATSTIPLDFDQGNYGIVNQAPSTWRYFNVVVPTNAFGWDVRLTNVLSGLPRIVVRRETVPNSLTTTPWSTPGTTFNWPTNNQWAPSQDWTRRSFAPDGITSEDGRILAMGMKRPLEPGNYVVGVMNSTTSTNMTYTISSRGIGDGFAIPVVDLPFDGGSITNNSLGARDAAYYRVVVASNTPSWNLKLENVAGESMLAGLRGALPNFDTINSGGTLTNGKSMQKLGNEHFVQFPYQGSFVIPPGTNYFAVVSEGINPGSSGRVGTGNSSYVIRSLGSVDVPDLGLVTSEDIVQPDTLEGGEVKAYQFSVPWGTYGVKIRIENRVNNPVATVVPGFQLPDPGANLPLSTQDTYGNEGGYAALDGGPTVVTLPNPSVGYYTMSVKARQITQTYPDASYTLRIQEILAPELNFTAELNTNGLSNESSALLQDNERAFFKIQVPSTVNGQPVIGWKLDVSQSSGLASIRVRRDLLPSDANSGSQMPFTTASAIIAPPYLTNGTWFVEVKGSNSTTFTLRSSALTLERPAWVMPAPGATNQTPGLTLPTFGDTGIDTNGAPLAADQSIFLEQGSLDYYAVVVSSTNQGLLRAQLEAISGNPDLYLRVGSVPTLYHNVNGSPGTIYDRSMLAASGTEYANWVPLDGKIETQLKPGIWYLAVRAASNANARYRLRLTVGTITDLPIDGPGLSSQSIAGGDWRYYRVNMPTALPLSFTVTFSQQSGDVWMYLRDVIPPGNGTSGSDYKDWSTDTKNGGPYQSFDPPGSYTFNAPPVRPGRALYLGFRAINDATFTVRATTNGAPTQEPANVAFYGGSATTTVGAFSSALYRVDVPMDAVRWRHTSLHTTNISVYLAQGTLATPTAKAYSSVGANSSLSQLLVNWDNTLKQYVAGSWPWIVGQSYYFLVTNTSAGPQDFTLFMDGRNAQTDDSDSDTLPDAWELYFWGNLGQTAGTDYDGDGISNYNEFLEGTSPTDAGDFRPRLITTATNGIVVRSPDLASYPLNSSVTLTPVPNTGYAFIGWGGQASGLANPLTFNINGHKSIFAVFKLAGDDFITSLQIIGSSVVTYGTNVGFTKELGEPNHAGNPGGKSMWWNWTAPTSGQVSFSTAGSTFNTLLGVYTGSSVNGLTLVASDNNSLGGTNRSFVSFYAIQGTTYNIAVDGYNGASARITLTLASVGTVTAPILSQVQRMPSNMLQFTLTGDPVRTYSIQVSTNLLNWDPLSTVTTAGNGSAVFSNAVPSTSVKWFYRAHYP